MANIPKMMKAATIDRFGGIEEIKVRMLPVPEVGPNEVLVALEAAGVGVWDPFEIEGGFDAEFGTVSKFPRGIGSEGAGTVVAIGKGVTKFKEGDRVYAIGLLNPKGGCYAQYIAVDAEHVSLIPRGLSVEQAAVMSIDAITALVGLDDTLGLKSGESVMIFGASGGIGHMAVQLAKRMGARVLAVASGNDGVELCKRIGADVTVDGHKDDIVAAARKFAPEGLDTALLTAGGDAAEKALGAVRDGGRVAYPNGVEPVPEGRPSLTMTAYNGTPTAATIEKINKLIEAGPFTVEVGRVFPLDQAVDALRSLDTHFIGKIALRAA